MLSAQKLPSAWLLTLVAASAFALKAAAADPSRAWPPDQFAAVTAERIAALSAGEQPAWKSYWAASQKLAKSLPSRSVPDFSPLQTNTAPPRGALHTKGLRLDAPPEWYASAEARSVADGVVAWQSAAGAWTKGIDYTQPVPGGQANHDVWSGGTFDNNATTSELRFLARVAARAGGPAQSTAWRESFLRGLRYIFDCQYPNGGFPQIYPLVSGYHDAVTFNDGAMTRVLDLLRDVATGNPEFEFVPADLRQEAQRRLDRGVQCVLATQLKGRDGHRTVWCQQYDALTLQPCAARNFEPIAAGTAESVGLAGLLMTLPRPSVEVVRAVDDAMTWFRRVALRDMVWERHTNDAQVAVVPGAPPLWARFYELETDKPIFGDRDRTIHYVVSEVSQERRRGYAWYGNWPAKVLETYEVWHKKVAANLRRNH